MRSRMLAMLIFSASLLLAAASWPAAKQTAAQSTATPAAKSHESASENNNPARLAQLMRGIMFPNSNVIFFASSKDPAGVPPAKRPDATANPLEGTYGQWEAVENSSLAIAEAASLLTVPSRVCSNGRPVPTANADWAKLVQGLRDAGMQCYRAAQSKDQNKIIDATDVLTTACSNCHVKYRDKDKLEDRCR